MKRFGLRLLPEHYEHLNPMPFGRGADGDRFAEDLRRGRLHGHRRALSIAQGH